MIAESSTVEALLRDFLFGGSVVVSTLLVYIAWTSIRDWQTHGWGWNRLAQFNASRALLCVGLAGIVMLITESILLRVPSVPVTTESVLYLVCLILSILGGLGMAFNWIRSSERNGEGKL